MVQFQSPSESGAPPPEPQGPSFWSRTWTTCKTTLSWIGSKLLGPVGAILLVIAAVVLASIGFKDLKIGGIFGKLLGKDGSGGDDDKTVEEANSVDKGRVGPDGKVIPEGQPDSKGDTQAVVVPIEDPGLFSDPGSIKFIPPGETKPTDVDLPDGVKNKDVDEVIIVKPDVTVVTVQDNSNVTPEKVDDLLKKYGG